MSRRKGRILAVQGLYSWDVGEKKDKEEVLSLSWAKNDSGEETLDDESGAFARILIAGTIDNLPKIDELITTHLTGWSLDRISKVSLAVLRMSVYSLLFMKDVPAAIVIDEAIDISKDFGQDDSFKFINGILDNIKKAI